MKAIVFVCALLGAVSALDNGEAITPPMGWRSWNAFLLDIDQTRILQQVDAVVAPGPNGGKSLQALGFGRIGIDDGWQACGAGVKGSFHDAQGVPLVNNSRFPDMLAMNRDAHSKNVKMGWYFNNCWCCENKNNVAHYQQDVDALIASEFDGVKIDGCGPAHNISLWTDAILKQSRPILIENCGDNHKTWSAPTPADVEECNYNFYRVSTDIAPQFYSTMYNLQATIPFLNLTRPMSRPGCWAYPDMLQVGNNMNYKESRSHFGAWCIVSAPLILGFDLSNKKLYDEVYPLLSNEDAIGVNQAWYGHPGRLVKSSTQKFRAPAAHGAECSCCDHLSKCEQTSFPKWQVWAKPLSAGKQAVFIVNISEEPQDVNVALSELGMASKAHAFDVWQRASAPDVTDQIIVKQLQSHDSIFLILADA